MDFQKRLSLWLQLAQGEINTVVTDTTVYVECEKDIDALNLTTYLDLLKPRHGFLLKPTQPQFVRILIAEKDRAVTFWAQRLYVTEIASCP